MEGVLSFGMEAPPSSAIRAVLCTFFYRHVLPHYRPEVMEPTNHGPEPLKQ